MSKWIDEASMVSTTLPITVDNLPACDVFEEDGSCWRAVRDDSEERGWRWQPMNWQAFGKGEPNSPMTDVLFPKDQP